LRNRCKRIFSLDVDLQQLQLVGPCSFIQAQRGDHDDVVWLWLVSPFVLIAVISHDSNMRDLVTVHHKRCQAIGWAGVAAMLLGAALVPATFGTVLFGIGTPLAGLIVWTRRDDGDDGGEEPPDDVPPDWDAFERSFRTYERRGGPPSHRPPRAPVAR
jgi:hypothetical protein